MDWTFSWFLGLICLQFFFISETSSQLQFAEWAKSCKLPTLDPNDFLKPHEECDNSRGLICQTFKEGPLCGCQIGGALTYDRSSRECRRKVGAPCHVPPASATKEDYSRLTFNHKCHEDAMCAKLNDTVQRDSRKSSPQYMCICKPGFVALQDFSACVDPNGSGSLHGDVLFSLVFIPILMVTNYFYR